MFMTNMHDNNDAKFLADMKERQAAYTEKCHHAKAVKRLAREIYEELDLLPISFSTSVEKSYAHSVASLKESDVYVSDLLNLRDSLNHYIAARPLSGHCDLSNLICLRDDLDSLS